MDIRKITVGGGCFWCVEAVFNKIQGVQKAVSGYMGGKNPNPTYKEVCSGTTGHAEVVEITYDNDMILLKELLEVFWTVHDPTTLNRQGNDVGTQYRSVIYHANEAEKQIITDSIEQVQKNYMMRPSLQRCLLWKHFMKLKHTIKIILKAIPIRVIAALSFIQK